MERVLHAASVPVGHFILYGETFLPDFTEAPGYTILLRDVIRSCLFWLVGLISFFVTLKCWNRESTIRQSSRNEAYLVHLRLKH